MMRSNRPSTICLIPLLLASTLLAQDQQTSADRTTATPSPQPDEGRYVSLNPKVFARNFFSDQKKIWTFPAKVATGKHLLPTVAVLGVTAAIAAGADPPVARYFRRTSRFNSFSDTFSEHKTTAAILLTPAAFYGVGLITRDSYTKRTGLLIAEAWVDVDILGEVMRNMTLRRRPLDIPPNANFATYRHTWFKEPLVPLKATGGFPSGHTAWGFAVATVVARRYPQHRWVRYAAYGLASVDLFSRITSNNHFISDDLFGAVLGYSTARFVVLRQ